MALPLLVTPEYEMTLPSTKEKVKIRPLYSFFFIKKILGIQKKVLDNKLTASSFISWLKEMLVIPVNKVLCKII